MDLVGMNLVNAVVGSVPGPTTSGKLRLAFARAARTFLQGTAAAFASGGAGSAILSTGYWETFGVAVLGAAITAAASFLQNVASFLPEDPTQQSPGPPPAPPPAPTPAPS